ncbi:MAG: chromate efflux transporter [Caulobacterales bacterium]
MNEQIKPSLWALTRESIRVGCLGFGGPAGQIALMHRVFVDERKWIDDTRFQHMLSFCMLLPGPEAQQLATYVGWRMHGALGALIAGWLFVLPGAAIVLALSWTYALWGDLPLIAALFDGVKCAVVALVIEAMLRIAKRSLKTRGALLIALAAFVALMLGAPFPLVIVAAGIWGAVFAASPRVTEEARSDSGALREGGEALRNAAAWAVLWLSPVAALYLTLGPGHVLTQIALVFSLLACVTFGGAYALLAYLTSVAAANGWLTPAQMIDGLGLAETTPGPLVLVNEFVGFIAGWGEGGALLALAGAGLALWCTFAPSFVWIFAGAPFAERLEREPRAAGALAAITAAVLGIIAKLALFFAAHALFAPQVRLGPIDLPDVTAPRLWAIGLAALATVALVRFKAPLIPLLLACAAAGWGASTLSLP